MLRAAIFLLSLSTFLGCAFNNAPANAFYGLGARSESNRDDPRIDEPLLVEAVHAPSWLDTTAIVYRLAYTQEARHQAYAHSYWAGPPSDLLTARLTARLADSTNIVRPGQGIPADHALRVELIEFVQVFESPQSSSGLVQMRASLINGRSLVAQQSFGAAKPAPSPDASGAVRALSDAADSAISEIVEWVAKTIKKN